MTIQHFVRAMFVSFLALIAVVSMSCAASSNNSGKSISNAYSFLDTQMDQFHTTYWVYQDTGSAGNHFHARGAIINPSFPTDLAAVHMQEDWADNVHSGATCIRCSFDRNATIAGWAGFYLMNGVLLSGDVQPRPNWGDFPNAGVDLTGATSLTFWARGEQGGELIDLFVGGVGRDAFSGAPTKPYPDSLSRAPSFNHTFKLTKNWKRYKISVTGRNLSYVLGGLGWVASTANNPTGAIFYLDDISFNKRRLEEPRFVVSYRTIPSSEDFDLVMRNVAFVYDNALTLLVDLGRANSKSLHRAKLIADALVYAQAHDRFYSDGRLRNAYMAGDLILPPGWVPNGRPDTVAMPGWWDSSHMNWYEDEKQVSTDTGNMAWTLLALTSYYQHALKTIGPIAAQPYLDAAVSLGNWIADPNNCFDMRGAGGYTGGFLGWEPMPTRLLWKSTEHNIDCYAAFMHLYQLTGDTTWKADADHAAAFLTSMWNSEKGYFWTGTLLDGVTPNPVIVPLDAQAWAILALGSDNYSAGLQWVIDHNTVNVVINSRAYVGFDFNDDCDGIWWEGTAQMALAFQVSGLVNDALTEIQNLRVAQKYAPGGDQHGLVSATPGPLTTGLDWLYYPRLHIGATAWFLLALTNQNPFAGLQ